MIENKSLMKVLCTLALLGLTVSARGINGPRVGPRANPRLNATTLQGSSFNLWDDSWCDDVDEWFSFPHPLRCESFLICFEGRLYEDDCDDDEIFDDWYWECMSPDEAICELPNIEPDPDHDPECPPPGSSDIVFLPSDFCEHFYICINGQPVQLNCRPGQHWNIDGEFCDDPESAGCEVSPMRLYLKIGSNLWDLQEDKTSPPNEIPDCPPNFVGQLPHPHNCNWFIHCNNGNRSIQQCQHMHHFDMERRECLFHSVARCIKQARLR